MPRACTVCRHPEIEAINAALARAESLRSLGRAFRLTHRSLVRHQQEHLGRTGAADTLALGEPALARRLEIALRLARVILAHGEAANDFPSALSAIREAVAVLDAANG